MTAPIYKQSDSRWGSLPYPSKPYTISRSGCGCCAVTHAVMEQPQYAGYTPKNTQPYMKQYATRGNGTLWKGILAGLKHYGYETKQLSANTMSPVWNALEQGKHIGVIRMTAGSRGGIRWTSSGHYICFVDYEVKNGKHYFKIKDSGRGNNGWFCYEDHMKGMFGPIWISKRKHYKEVGKYNGELPTSTLKKGSKGDDVKLLQKFLNAVYKAGLTVDGKFGSMTDGWVGVFQIQNGLAEDGIVGSATIKKMKEYVK